MSAAGVTPRRAALAALVLFVGIAAGCTDSDQLNSGVGRTTIQVDITNADTRFDEVFYRLQEIRIVPVDPQAEAVQETPLLMVSTLNAIDIEQGADPPTFTSNVDLTAGLYRITRVSIVGLDIRSGTSANDGTCKGSITSFTTANGSPFAVMTGPFRLAIPDDIIAEATVDGSGVFRIQFDGSAFVDAFVDNWVLCQDPRFPGGTITVNCSTQPPGCTPANAFGNFNTNGFQAAAEDYLSFP